MLPFLQGKDSLHHHRLRPPEPRGVLRMLIGMQSDEILGFTAFGVEESELMAIVRTAMIGHLPYTTLRQGIFTHPTVAEGLTTLVANVPAKATWEPS